MHVSQICAELVKIRSENPPGRTDDIIEYIRMFLEKLGIRSVVFGNAEGMCNLITKGTGKSLLLCGHVDVVPALDDGWTLPPFSATIDERWVHGRGTTDMKGGCASILGACEVMVNEGIVIPATLAFVCDEETGGENGIQRLLADRVLTPGDCLIAEPTPARNPSIGQKGLCRLALKFSGTPAHGSLYPAVGVSAIMEAMRLLEYVQGLHQIEYPVDDHLKEIISRSSAVLAREFNLSGTNEILKKLTFNPGIISGGEKSNIVAQHCDLELEFRIPWGCSLPQLLSDLSLHAGTGKIVSQEIHQPSLTDPSCPLVGITCREVQRVYGGEVFPIVQWAASDARHLRLHGFNVLEYGPGEISTLHSMNERVTIDSLEKASLIYQGVMAKYGQLA